MGYIENNDNVSLLYDGNTNSMERYRLLEQSWERFVGSGIESRQIRKEIMHSWVRCRENFVDPYKECDVKVLPNNEFKERYNKAKEMIAVALPIMKYVYDSVKVSGFIFVLTDIDGVILEIYGDIKMRKFAESIAVLPGAIGSESMVGTTAPGICLKEKKPMQVYFKEHYCRFYHQLACSAAPIFNPEGRLIGSLVLSGMFNQAHPHTLTLAITTAKSIEREICYRAANKELKKSRRYVNSIINSITEEAIISYNNQGKIIHINAECANLLGIPIQDCMGTPVDDVIENIEILNDLFTGTEQITNRKITLLTRRGKIKVNANFKAIKDDDTNTVNMYLGIFNKIEKDQRNLNKKIGLMADYTFDDLIYESKKMQNVIKSAKKISSKNSTILIEGESGTGKELLAQSIHNYGNRSNKPFMAVNCAAIPKELIQSELFGYEHGSFTGAKQGGKQGKFEAANGGTIFLDEVGDMPLEVQTTILRVLQEKQFMRVGGNHNIPLDIRVIAATNKQLKSEIEKGSFRFDLYNRLNVVPFHIPPLRDRPEDIILLARYFIKKYCLSLGIPEILLSPEVEKIFLAHNWPGNIRELENVITYIIDTMEGTTINPDNLPVNILSKKPAEKSLVLSLEESERMAILNALNYFGNNISKVAKCLGISRVTLYKKIKKYKLDF